MRRQVFNAAAIGIARLEIHVAILVGTAQQAIDLAHAVEPVFPMVVRDETQAGDQVLHRHRGHRLPVMLIGNGTVKVMTQPPHFGAQSLDEIGIGLVLIADALHQLHCERQPLRRRCAIGEDIKETVHVDPAIKQHLRPFVRQLPHAPQGSRTCRDAPQVLDEDEAQADGRCPELTDRERAHILVGVDEGDEHRRIEAAVRVGDEGPGNAEDLRMTSQRAGSNLGQLPVIAGR